MTIESLQKEWQDEPNYHVHINDLFKSLVEQDSELNAHRTWVRDHVFGMGEDSFHWFWKLLVDEFPDDFSFIEIGVHKSQVLSLIRILSNRTGKKADIYGITPMDGTGTGWTQDDYEGDIKRLHDEFNLEYPNLHKGLSESKEALAWSTDLSDFDCLYVDGNHSEEGAYNDILNYGAMVKPGGYLVIDDANCDLNFPPSGYFTGIAEVTKAKQDYMAENGEKWEFVFSVVHLAIYRRK